MISNDVISRQLERKGERARELGNNNVTSRELAREDESAHKMACNEQISRDFVRKCVRFRDFEKNRKEKACDNLVETAFRAVPL